jgi:hypothetical protein
LSASYVLKRLVAYTIDLGLVAFPASLVVAKFEVPILEWLPERFHGFGGISALGISTIPAALLLGICTGLWGRTPGKLITFLKVKDPVSDEAPGLAQGLLREIVKAVSIALVLPIFWGLQGLLTTGRPFYDHWLDLEVEDLRPSGLTPTQKKFREYMRKQGRR